jgi:hypothetical protein
MQAWWPARVLRRHLRRTPPIGHQVVLKPKRRGCLDRGPASRDWGWLRALSVVFMPLGQPRDDGKIRRRWRVPSPRRCGHTRPSGGEAPRNTLLYVAGCFNLCMDFWGSPLGPPSGDNGGKKMRQAMGKVSGMVQVRGSDGIRTLPGRPDQRRYRVSDRPSGGRSCRDEDRPCQACCVGQSLKYSQ